MLTFSSRSEHKGGTHEKSILQTSSSQPLFNTGGVLLFSVFFTQVLVKYSLRVFRFRPDLVILWGMAYMAAAKLYPMQGS
jgi:hypothetical protein